MTDASSQCPKCKAHLHSCRQCAHFDPGSRFQCTQPIPERIADKRARNDCTHYTLHVTVERETSAASGFSGRSPSSRPDDPRRALDDLFKKK